MGKVCKVSLQDIAERAGVSRMTVSRALRNHPEVSAATRQRIRKVAEQMGYQTNPLVSALMANLRTSTRRTGLETIAYLTTHSESRRWRQIPILSRFHAGALDRCRELGFALEEFSLGEPGITAERISRILWARNIRGILVAPAPQANFRIRLDWNHFASVAIGHSVSEPLLDQVFNHQIHSLRVALDKAQQLGYRRCGLIMEQEHNERVDRNWEMALLGFQNRMPKETHVPILLPKALTFQNFREWFLNHSPDLLLTTTAKFPAQMISWLKRLQISVPDDIGLITLNKDRPDSPVSGIDQQPELLGKTAIELIAEQMYHNNFGTPSTPKIVLIPGRWIPGRTVRRVR